MGFLVGTDVGGTFTDLWVAADSGDTRVFKSPTTDDVLGGVLATIALAAGSYGLSFEQFCGRIERFGHGTTVGLNALLTGSAAKDRRARHQGLRRHARDRPPAAPDLGHE